MIAGASGIHGEGETMTEDRAAGRSLGGWWQALNTRLQVVLVIVLVAALIPPAVWGYQKWRYCAADIARADGSCVGITDGSHGPVFGAGTADALEAIGEENARIAADPGGKDVVTIAYVVPIPPPGVEDDYAVRLSGDVMGAAVAQRQANRTNTLGDRPLIRLLIANVGDSAEPAVEPIRKLIDMAGPGFAEQKLMAVAVSGKSLNPLIGVVDELVAAQVPVLISHLTAEEVTSTPVAADSSLARVTPTTWDEAAALAAYLKPSTRSALIVQNSDRRDRYAASLGQGFRDQYADGAHTIQSPDETYIGGASAANTMDDILVHVCQQRPDVVMFAGRAAELAPFVAALPKRTCPDHPVRIVTGDDGASFAEAVARDEPGLRDGLRANASVAYTSLAHPGAWRAAPDSFAPGTSQYLTGDCEECFPTLFPGRNLDDSYAIMAYDAVLTAVTAIRQPDESVSSPEAVVQEFKRIHGPQAVAGASGWISLDSAGSTVDKAVAIMDVVPDGSARFLQLSSPSGVPCRPGTPPC
jgi:ABC-type branched-subunit amino acid transport system substrate-binding protein